MAMDTKDRWRRLKEEEEEKGDGKEDKEGWDGMRYKTKE